MLYKANETKSNAALRPQGARRISSLRAFRRAREGAAKGRGSWERIRWPDAKFEVTSAKCDLRNEQQREKREESREKREERSEKREKCRKGKKVESRGKSLPFCFLPCDVNTLRGTNVVASVSNRRLELTSPDQTSC